MQQQEMQVDQQVDQTKLEIEKFKHGYNPQNQQGG
jgi:hypothetical protein